MVYVRQEPFQTQAHSGVQTAKQGSLMATATLALHATTAQLGAFLIRSGLQASVLVCAVLDPTRVLAYPSAAIANQGKPMLTVIRPHSVISARSGSIHLAPRRCVVKTRRALLGHIPFQDRSVETPA